MIELKNIHKVFEVNSQKIYAVDGVNLTIQDGEIFGIIGYAIAKKIPMKHGKYEKVY